MTEADYMDDCQQVHRWDDENKKPATHEVVFGSRNEVRFSGSRAACWDFKKHNGGYVRAVE